MTHDVPTHEASAQLVKYKSLVTASPAAANAPFFLAAFSAGSKSFLYRSTSILSPPNAKTVRIPLNTSSTTFAAFPNALSSFVDINVWNLMINKNKLVFSISQKMVLYEEKQTHSSNDRVCNAYNWQIRDHNQC